MSFQRDTPFFKGAYFRKVTSQPGQLVSISGIIRMPQPTFDPTCWYRGDRRYGDALKNPTNSPLDTPNVYLGGRAAGTEVDVGLTFERRWQLLDGAHTGTFTDLASRCDGDDPNHRFVVRKVAGTWERLNGHLAVVATAPSQTEILQGLTPNFAYRVFWRVREWKNPDPGAANDPYFYPGQRVKLSLTVSAPGKLEFGVRLLEAGNANVYSFDAANFHPAGTQSFKRVVSIDQYFLNPANTEEACGRSGNEGLDVIPTNTQLKGAHWENCQITRANGSTKAVAGNTFLEVPGEDTAPHYDQIFLVTGLGDQGQESLDIIPPARQIATRLGTQCPG